MNSYVEHNPHLAGMALDELLYIVRENADSDDLRRITRHVKDCIRMMDLIEDSSTLDKRYVELMFKFLAYVQECERECVYQEKEEEEERVRLAPTKTPKTTKTPPPALLEPFPEHLIRMTLADK